MYLIQEYNKNQSESRFWGAKRWRFLYPKFNKNSS